MKFLTERTSTNKMHTVVAGAVVQVDGEQYTLAYTGYTAVKVCPFGSFAGGKFFGAQGIFVENMDPDDIKNFQLINSDGDPEMPPNYVDITVSAVIALDRVAVFLLDGVGGNIDKDMCGGVEATPAGSDFLNVTGPIPTYLPPSGVIRVVDDTDSSEQFYTYAAIDVAGLQFTGLSPVTDRDYTASDRCYVPFIDEEAVGTSVSKTIIQGVVEPVIVRVRKKGIIPFEVESSITSTGMAVTAIRTTDTIVT
jgi:hypothetical protein